MKPLNNIKIILKMLLVTKAEQQELFDNKYAIYRQFR